MATFRFQLQTVLEQYEEQLEQAQLALVKLVSIEQQFCQNILAVETAQAEMISETHRYLQQHGHDMLIQQQFLHANQTFRDKTQKLQHQLMQHRQKMLPLQEAVQKAYIRVKSLEKLKEKAYNKYRLDQLKQEQAFLEELALRQYIQR